MVVIASSEVGDDDIAFDFAWLDFVLVAGLNPRQIVRDGRVQIHSFILGINVDPPWEPNIRIRVDEDFAGDILNNG